MEWAYVTSVIHKTEAGGTRTRHTVWPATYELVSSQTWDREKSDAIPEKPRVIPKRWAFGGRARPWLHRRMESQHARAAGQLINTPRLETDSLLLLFSQEFFCYPHNDYETVLVFALISGNVLFFVSSKLPQQRGSKTRHQMSCRKKTGLLKSDLLFYPMRCKKNYIFAHLLDTEGKICNFYKPLT